MRIRILLLLLLAGTPAFAQQHHPASGASPYAGQERRAIKSLSEEDIAELRRGGGWGLAKPAELNGVPGPAHLLELAREIPVDPEQATALRAIFERMQSEAIRWGEALIAAEAAIEAAFRDGPPDGSRLRALLDAAERARTELRFVHLAAHLETPALLRPDQIRRYAALRGYDGDIYRNPPAGHDPTLWRRHMGCE